MFKNGYQKISMKIYINIDNNNKRAVETKEKLTDLCLEYGIDISDNAGDAELICSVGGDGTFLKSSKLAFNKPIVGINTGTLGYLTEINPENLKEFIESILNDDYRIEERMMLEGEILKNDGNIIKIPQSLNEIAVCKNTFGIIRFDVFINDRLINSYTADGILVSTPTGTTAYNLSCGGPIAEPDAKIITLTPIAPHSIINRSIVLSDESVVKIKITELRENTVSYVMYDGEAIEVETGDEIIVKKSKKVTKIIKLEERSFIDTIRENIN